MLKTLRTLAVIGFVVSVTSRAVVADLRIGGVTEPDGRTGRSSALHPSRSCRTRH